MMSDKKKCADPECPRIDARSVRIRSRLWAWPFHCAAVLLAAAWLPGAAFAQAPEPGPLIGSAALPRDLSPWGMFMSADVVVKGVIVGLALASVVTWTTWLAKTIE